MTSTRPTREQLNVVILAAGRCSRMARPYPKALARLSDGRSILERQLELVDALIGPSADVWIVVGFKAPLIVDAIGERAGFVSNDEFSRTNTARSLLRAFDVIGEGGVLWLNGDVVFEPGVLSELVKSIGDEVGLVAVSERPVGEEEVKYRLDEAGDVRAISKGVEVSPGEAVGINYVPSAARDEFVRHLQRCSDDDYFERAIETSIAAGLRFRAVDLTGYGCVEVDVESDLATANEVVRLSALPLVPR